MPWRPSEEGHTQRYIRQKPSKINKYRAMQQPTMTCRYRIGRLLFILITSIYSIMIDKVILYTKLMRKIMMEGYARQYRKWLKKPTDNRVKSGAYVWRWYKGDDLQEIG